MNPQSFKEQWEEILESVEKTKIPLSCIKKMTIKLSGRRQKSINISTLQKQGLDLDEIEAFLNRKIDEYGDDVLNIDFFVDVERVSEIVQPATDDLLKKL